MLPPGFVPLKLEEEGDGKAQISIDFLVNATFESLDIKEGNAEENRAFLEILVIAGYYDAAASVDHIPDELIFDGKVFFASSNLCMLNRFLGSRSAKKWKGLSIAMDLNTLPLFD